MERTKCMVRDFDPDSGKDGRERALVQGEQRLNNVLGAFPNEMARSSQKQGALKALHPTLPCPTLPAPATEELVLLLHSQGGKLG